MILPKTSGHLNNSFLSKDVRRILDEKIQLFKKHNLFDACLVEQTGVLIDYYIYNTKENVSGYCDYKNKIISINQSIVGTEECERQVLFHEIAHAVQADIGMFNTNNCYLLSSQLKLEWEAENFAFVFYNSIYKPLSHREFNSYFTHNSVVFLKEYYGNLVQNDVNV